MMKRLSRLVRVVRVHSTGARLVTVNRVPRVTVYPDRIEAWLRDSTNH
jgi:hypothetical protein